MTAVPTMAREGAPTAATPGSLRTRRARWSDANRLVRLYLSLSPGARHAFHPFPFRRSLLWVIYRGLLGYGALARPLMRRFPRLIAEIVIVERTDSPDLLAYGTVRGVVRADGSRCVRFGVCVGEGSRGQHVGEAILVGLGEEALSMGMTTAIATTFKSSEPAIRLVTRFGFTIRDSDWVDPGAPDEKNVFLEVDLVKVLRPAPPAAEPPASEPAAWPQGSAR